MPELVDNFVKFCSIRSEHNKRRNPERILDLTDHNFFYPTTLLPTLEFRDKNSLSVLLNPRTHGYVRTILYPSKWPNKTYVPFRVLRPFERSGKEKILEEIFKLMDHSYGGKMALDLLLYEFTDNIYEHSEFSRAFIMAQKYPKKEFTEICFYDNGISIPGNFSKYGIDYTNDQDAVKKAIEGTSTKDEFAERGWGINRLVEMFIKEANGEIFIASRNGGVYVDKNKPRLYKLGNTYKIHGTLLSLRISKSDIDIYPYIESKESG
ncbi:MAG: ATP-binding protein [Methanobacterium formicicum]